MLNSAYLEDTSPKIQLISVAQSRQVGVMRNYALEDQDCDNLKSIKISIEECLPDLPDRRQRRRRIDTPKRKGCFCNLQGVLTSAMDLVKGVITD